MDAIPGEVEEGSGEVGGRGSDEVGERVERGSDEEDNYLFSRKVKSLVDGVEDREEEEERERRDVNEDSRGKGAKRYIKH